MPIEDQRAHVPLFTRRHPDRRKTVFNQQLQHQRGISSIVLLFPRFSLGSLLDGPPGSRSPTPPSTPGTTASNRWLRSPHESDVGESSKTLAPNRPRAAKSFRLPRPSRRSTSQPSVVAYVSPRL